MSANSVRFETEKIEVTRDGSLPPYKPDYWRKFIPGLTTVYVTVDGVELPPMTPEEYATWKQAAPQGEAAPSDRERD